MVNESIARMNIIFAVRNSLVFVQATAWTSKVSYQAPVWKHGNLG